MEVEWKVDVPTLKLAWTRLNAIPVIVGRRTRPVRRILDVGGGNGGFAKSVARHHPDAEVYCVDITPRITDNGVIHIRGSGLDLPFTDACFDIVTVHAMLHHVPDEMALCLEEGYRVLRPGGVLIVQEPLSKNPISNLAGSFVRTERHDPGERPLDPAVLKKEVAAVFEIVEEEYFFLVSYLLPHIIPRLPRGIRRLARRISGRIIMADRKMVASMPKLRHRTSYASIVAVKR